MRVVLIGSGNTATVLGRMIREGGHEVLQVYSRNPEHAAHLADKLGCSFVSDVESIHSDADIYLVALADKALSSIHTWFNTGRKLVLHTAGSVSKHVLSKVSTKFGILYPLQSLRKDLEKIPTVPLLIDGNTLEDLALIEDFARSISPLVYKVGDHDREAIHLAAVIVSNFTNHLYALAADYCHQQQLDFMMLKPLIEEVAVRLRTNTPQQTQTGPAIREDRVTIEKHLQNLASFPDLQKLYQVFSEEIIRYYRK